RCPDYGDCFYYKARRAMHGANILVVNHALFFTDLALRRVAPGLLPDYKAVIFDEAHTLEDVAAEHLGVQVSRGGLDYLLNKLHHPRNGRGLLACHRSPETVKQVDAVRFAADRFFGDIVHVQRRERTTGRVRTPFIVPDPLSEELLKLSSGL